MRRHLIFAALCAAPLAGCYAPHWQDTEIMVATMPPGAVCTLTRQGEKLATIDPTPGIALVSRSSDDVAITCRRNGYSEAVAVSRSRGTGVDMDTLWKGRKGYDYETPVNIPLTPNRAAAAKP